MGPLSPEPSLEADMKKRFISFAAVYMLIPAMLLAQPAGKKQLVGVWAVKEVPVGQSPSPLLSLAMFRGDGSLTKGVGYKAIPAIPALQEVATELGPGYGRWAATDNAGEFRLTFYSVMRKAGRVNGFQRAQETLVLSESGAEYTGHARVDFLDANWNVVFSTTSEVKGTRLETPNPAMLVGETAAKKPLVGIWEVNVSPIGQSPLLSLAMFGGDGSFTTAGGYKALPPVPAVGEIATEFGPGCGRWAATGNREFRLTFYSVLWKAGVVNGFQRVQDTLTLSESSDEYAGHAQADFLDANWNVVFSTSSEVKGTRLETPDLAVPVAQPAEREGVWKWKASLPGFSAQPMLGLNFVGEDGSSNVSGGSTAPPVPAVQAVANEIGPSFGRLVRTGDREFRVTTYALMWKAGQVNGFQRLQSRQILSESGDEWISHATMEVLDTKWTVVFSTTSEAKGTRLETPGRD
jgi:hypothetical protein